MHTHTHTHTHYSKITAWLCAQRMTAKYVKTHDIGQKLLTRHWLPSDLPIVRHFLHCAADIVCADAVTEAFDRKSTAVLD